MDEEKNLLKENEGLRETIRKKKKTIEEQKREISKLNREIQDLKFEMKEMEKILNEPREEQLQQDCKIEQIMNELKKCNCADIEFIRMFDRIKKLVK